VTDVIRELEQKRFDPGAIDAFLNSRTFPIVEGTAVTFVFRGHADQVLLRHWIYGLPASQAFQRLHGTDVWFLTITVPRGSRIEYKIELAQGPQRRLVQDPLNPNLARDPYGANSVVHAEGYSIPDWVQPDPEARRGELTQIAIDGKALGRSDVTVYLPARFRQRRRYPLCVVHDGDDFLRFTSLQTVLDNLIHRLEIPPMIFALTQSPNRLHEYADDPRHGDFLTFDLLPQLAARFPLVDAPAGRGLMGASFGAVAALSTAWRHQGVWGCLMLQSGSFAFTDIGDHDRGPLFDPVVRFVNAFRESPGRPADKIYLSCGIYESLIYYNRSLLPVLQGTPAEVRFVEARDGHNWENWRDRLREGLSWLYPGPLWMVYE
jgi:enterochelin esterase family protein